MQATHSLGTAPGYQLIARLGVWDPTSVTRAECNVDVWAVLETACGDGGRARGLEEDTCRTATLARAPQSADTSCDWASACAT